MRAETLLRDVEGTEAVARLRALSILRVPDETYAEELVDVLPDLHALELLWGGVDTDADARGCLRLLGKLPAHLKRFRLRFQETLGGGGRRGCTGLPSATPR